MLLLQLKRYPRTYTDMLTKIIVPIPLQVFIIIPFFFHLEVEDTDISQKSLEFVLTYIMILITEFGLICIQKLPRTLNIQQA